MNGNYQHNFFAWGKEQVHVPVSTIPAVVARIEVEAP